MASPSVRPASLADLPGIYRVCLATGHPEGEEGDCDRDPDLLGHVYAGPYVVADASLCSVVADAAGVAGYVLSTADTAAFEAWAERHWWPQLRERYPLGSAVHPAVAKVHGSSGARAR